MMNVRRGFGEGLPPLDGYQPSRGVWVECVQLAEQMHRLVSHTQCSRHCEWPSSDSLGWGKGSPNGFPTISSLEFTPLFTFPVQS